MKTIRFFAVMIAVFVACGIVSAQELKPLRCFDNEVEYLKYNLKFENEPFKGRSLGEFFNEVEVEFRAVMLSHGSSGPILTFLIQEYDYLADKSIKVKTVYETTVYFEMDDVLREAVEQQRRNFFNNPRSGGLYPLTQRNKARLIEILKDAKIEVAFYYEQEWFSVTFQ